MIEETEKMREARHELQLLSASDPLARANMLRHVAACTEVLTGRPGVDARAAEPLVVAGFRLIGNEASLFGSFTRRDGVERIYIAFDINDAQGAPIGISLFRKEGEEVGYGICKLWSPANDGRALLVPTDEGSRRGYFAFRRGKPFRWIEGPVPGDLNAGIRRAQGRIAKLLISAEADAVLGRGQGTIMSNIGQTVLTQPLPMAA